MQVDGLTGEEGGGGWGGAACDKLTSNKLKLTLFRSLLDTDSLNRGPSGFSVGSFFKIDILTLRVLHAFHLLKVVLTPFFF